MHLQHPTLAELAEARARQDQDFYALCAELTKLDGEQRFRLSDERFAELDTAWRPRLPREQRILRKHLSLRA